MVNQWFQGIQMAKNDPKNVTKMAEIENLPYLGEFYCTVYFKSL